ncbi:zinc finger protein, putative [Plasmodium vivax]|uniref:Zinc finger protein, putative n=6 Tax=Plasmodium vivax TaxID=5855 RepID=A5K9H9_PLAVS|nr:zinc finger protein, putative [Plasmodium vivax]KMZ80193.1 zinc finger protein [Plasmodium vivax India VII]KMZ86280.1 zinc finger protein [Plasmodium vivax Brazil I]KMZ92639.1 zinc finger protein [Plasmodium vivax Mauritania I]KMZ99189.1 zinc finger protein [Plasmodium vivax North Korean]EDL44051.1 zinc finger protein, putative [Plasmodium vivax]|eukprot:XP_001613778.1 zinc finger protein [Plasmodium vivax Sal-1]
MAANPLGTDTSILDNNLTQIFRDSEEWLTLEYLLQMNVRTSRVRLVQAWHLSPVHLINKFEKRNANKLVLKSFIDVSSLDMDNSIQDVCTRGFSVSRRGLRLSVGNFNIPGFPLTSLDAGRALVNPNELAGEPGATPKAKKTLRNILKHSETVLLSGERSVFEFFLCDVGVGLSLSVSEKDAEMYNRDTVPVEYDSLFIDKQKVSALDDSLTIHYSERDEEQSGGISKGGTNREDQNSERINLALGGDTMASCGVLPHYTFHHEYIIFDNSQLLPRYLIQFECDPSGEEHFSLPLCDYCGNAPSVFFCESDEVKLCAKCDQMIHSQNKLVKKHIRKTLNEAQTISGKCKIHVQQRVSMFCTICHIPICNICVSSHSHMDLCGESFPWLSKKNDAIISLNLAYKAIIKHSAIPSNVVKEEKKKLNDVLKKVDKLYEQVRSNMKDAEKHVYTILEDVIKQLHETTDQKMCAVLSEEYELKRQFCEIAWNENFLYYLQTVLPPADFMNAWLKHCLVREEIERNSGHAERPHALVFPDMCIRGNINVATEESARHAGGKQH